MFSSAYKCFITRSYVEMGWIVVTVMVCVLWIEMFCEKNWLILTFEVVNGDFSYYDCD